MRGLLIVLALTLAYVGCVPAGADDGYYLHWNRDHTERAPRPMYPLTDDEARVLDSYHLDFEGDFLKKVTFFHAGMPSPNGDYGAFALVRRKTETLITEWFENAAGERVTNASGVWEVRYEGAGEGYWTTKVTLGPDGQPVNAGGYAKLTVIRDSKGRRVHEIRFDAAGDQVPEHNGFAMAFFGFDDNDFATYRQNQAPDGTLMDGANGFAEVRFRFDRNGNFLSEQVFDAAGKPKNFPAGYADIRFSNFDRFGRPHRIELKTETGAPFGSMPVIERSYLPSGQRAGQRYFLTDGTPGMDGQGAHEVRYVYDGAGKRTGILRFDVTGAEIKAE